MTAPILLDTCAVLWTAADAQITEEAEAALQEAFEADREVFVSPISAWELGILAARGRQRFPTEPAAWFNLFLEKSGCHLSSLSPEILVDSSFLPGTPPRDPADRIVICTARKLGYQVMTRDREILEYSEQGHVLGIEC
ncbi:MAG: type II toxin-antitoxin system VapC family toxin [Nitratireductor sp.]|nr:type II toxin-antitoxin system VapC family toxin [Nitratireductor sp.]